MTRHVESTGAAAYSASLSKGDDSASFVSQRSAPRTRTKRRLAIIGTVRAAEISVSTSTSPAVKRSSLKSATPPASDASRRAPTTSSRMRRSSPATKYTGRSWPFLAWLTASPGVTGGSLSPAAPECDAEAKNRGRTGPRPLLDPRGDAPAALRVILHGFFLGRLVEGASGDHARRASHRCDVRRHRSRGCGGVVVRLVPGGGI